MTDAVMQPKVHLRAMTADDLVAAHGLCQAVQWPHRIEDWAFNLSLGQGLVAERDGTVIGTAMCWPYGTGAATLGMIIVSLDCQGAGIGKRLITGLLDRLDGRSVLLNATQAGLPLYRALGFAPIGEIRQHQGAAFSVPVVALAAGERIRPIGRSDAQALVALDAAAAGMPRASLITALLAEAEGVILDRDGEPAGFALFRRFGRGYAIGPVIAPTITGAKALISHWIASNPGMFIRIDVPGDSGLSEWLDDLGLVDVGPVVTMVRGPMLDRAAAPRTWAIVSQALG